MKYLGEYYPGERISLSGGMEPEFTNLFSKRYYVGMKDLVENALSSLTPDQYGYEPNPELCPCEDAQTLVTEIFGRIELENCNRQAVAELTGKKYYEKGKRNQSRKKFRDWIGVPDEYLDFEKAGTYRYILMRLRKTVAVFSDDEGTSGITDFVKSEIHEAAGEAIGQMKTDERGNVLYDETNYRHAMDFVNSWGSHYIKAVELGDIVFQVYVYEDKKYWEILDRIQKDRIWGSNVTHFALFCTKSYCTYCGNVCLASENTAFQEIRRLLEDKALGIKESMLQLVTNADAWNRLNAIEDICCIGMKLHSLPQLISAGLKRTKNDSGPLENAFSDMADETCLDSCLTFCDNFSLDYLIPSAPEPDYKTLYASFCKGKLNSVLWTIYMTQVGLYINLNQYWNQKCLNKSSVKNIIVIADVIELVDDIDLSGLELVMLVCRKIICRAEEGKVPTILLAARAFDMHTLFCGSMSGVCRCEKAGEGYSDLIVNHCAAIPVSVKEGMGIIGMANGSTFPWESFKEEKNSQTEWIRNSISSGLQQLYVICDSVLSGSSTKELCKEIRACLQWLSSMLLQMAGDETVSEFLPDDLRLIYMNSEVMLKTSGASVQDRAYQVPALSFAAYQDVIVKLLEEGREYTEQLNKTEADIGEYYAEIQKSHQEDRLNDELIQISNFLTSQNSALAERETSMAAYYQAILDADEKSFNNLKSQQDAMAEKKNKYEEELNHAIEDFKNAVEQKEKEIEVRNSIEILLSMCAGLAGIGQGAVSLYHLPACAEGDGAEAANAQRCVQKWQGISRIADELDRFMTSVNSMVDFVRDMNQLNDAGFEDMIQELEAKEFVNYCEMKVSLLRNFVPAEAAELLRCAKNMAMLAEANSKIQVEEVSIKQEKCAYNSLKSIENTQTEKMKNLSININKSEYKPDEGLLLDLGQLNSELSQRQNGVLTQLAKIILRQDRALVYHYLSKPVVIEDNSISTLLHVLSEQAVNALNAMEQYPYPPVDLGAPVQYRIDKISARSLLIGEEIEIEVPVDEVKFIFFSRLRVKALDVRVENVKTNSGICHVRIESEGGPMYDRDFDRVIQTYYMAPKVSHVVYNIETGRTLVGTKPSADWNSIFTMPTPFQRYKISLPGTIENTGLEISGEFTAIILQFELEACYSEVWQTLKIWR